MTYLAALAYLALVVALIGALLNDARQWGPRP